MRTFLAILLVSVPALLGCGSHDRAVGEPCESDGDCVSEMCVMEPFLGSTCKDPCGGNDANCEPGYACTGRAAGNVAYCEPIIDEGATTYGE
jgi:hypothetical protein